MVDVSVYLKLKKQVDEAKAEKERAVGALQNQMARLKAEFDCDTLDDALELLGQLDDDRQKAERAFEKELKAFEAEWKEKIDG